MQKKFKQLKTDLADGKSVKVELKHFVSLPCEEAHSGHSTGRAAGYSQKFLLPVCICTAHSSSRNLTYTWHNMFNSQPSRYSPSTSLYANLPLPFTFIQDHIELAHSTDHYDSVVPCTGAQAPLSLLHIITKESDIILLRSERLGCCIHVLCCTYYSDTA